MYLAPWSDLVLLMELNGIDLRPEEEQALMDAVNEHLVRLQFRKEDPSHLWNVIFMLKGFVHGIPKSAEP